MKNIIIFGSMGSGKDTAAEMIQRHFNSRIAKIGGRVRRHVDEICNLMNLDDSKKRLLYQEYGQTMRRIFGQDIWNLYLRREIDQDLHNGRHIIIADGRQVNEVSFWRKEGFLLVGIDADPEIRIKRLYERDGYDQSSRLTHETEMQAMEIVSLIKEKQETEPDSGEFFYIDNNGTLEDLARRVEDLCNLIRE